MEIICVCHYSWGQSFSICKITRLDSISQVPCSFTSLQFFRLSCIQQPFFFLRIITCIYTALLTSKSFHIYYLSWFSSSPCEASGQGRQYYPHLTDEGNEILKGCNLPKLVGCKVKTAGIWLSKLSPSGSFLLATWPILVFNLFYFSPGNLKSS